MYEDTAGGAHVVDVQRVEQADELHAAPHLLLPQHGGTQRRLAAGSAALLGALQYGQVAGKLGHAAQEGSVGQRGLRVALRQVDLKRGARVAQSETGWGEFRNAAREGSMGRASQGYAGMVLAACRLAERWYSNRCLGLLQFSCALKACCA